MSSAFINFENCITEPYKLYDELNVNSIKVNIPTYDTKISKLFFSKSNIDYLQEQMVLTIYKKTKVEISSQSLNELIIVMKSIYLQNSTNNDNKLDDQLEKLNKLVLEYCIDNIISNMKQYDKYIKDITSEKKILSHPEFVNNDSKTYDLSKRNEMM